MLESLGFCKPGEGVYFFEEGQIHPGWHACRSTPMAAGYPTPIPACTAFSPLSKPHANCVANAAQRQVPNAKLSLVNGMGGMLSAAGTLVLSNEA